jgi:hypothetical protein
VAETIGTDGTVYKSVYELRGDRGQLRVTGPAEQRLAFYRKDYALLLDAIGRPTGFRTNFVRDRNGRVKWWRNGGTLHRHQP